MRASLAIGVFDSGMGGLTVLRALRTLLPAESFVYLGDTARLPYGTKSLETVQQYAIQMANVLVEKRIKALVIACNTATTAALPFLTSMLPDIPVIGVVSPGASVAISTTRNQRIAVFATEATIASCAYEQLITQALPTARVVSRACSVLVGLAEEGMIGNTVAREALKHYLSVLTNEDTLVLGCTHFPVFKPLLMELLPVGLQVVDTADATALALKHTLTTQSLLTQAAPTTKGTVQYLVTDSVQRFQRVGEIFLGETLALEHIELL